jgi:molybdopterin converting factor small subunit
VSTATAPVVTLTAYGKGRFESKVTGTDMKVADIVGEHEVKTDGHRVAVNGHLAVLDTPVGEKDEVTVIPRVFGG